MIIEWDNSSSIVLSSDVGYAKFRIKNPFTEPCVRSNLIGEFSCLKGTIKFVRRLSYYVIRYYAQTFLSVICSFVSFWLPLQAWPARVTLAVTPMLQLITQSININSDINVYYVTAIQWWMSLCIFFSFSCLIEYAIAVSWTYFIVDKKAAKNVTLKFVFNLVLYFSSYRRQLQIRHLL